MLSVACVRGLAPLHLAYYQDLDSHAAVPAVEVLAAPPLGAPLAPRRG